MSCSKGTAASYCSGEADYGGGRRQYRELQSVYTVAGNIQCRLYTGGGYARILRQAQRTWSREAEYEDLKGAYRTMFRVACWI